MTFRLKPGEPVSDSIRRIATEQVGLARRYLTDPPGGDIDEGIHEARKCFKRLRGLLRMARSALGDSRYRQENDRFRDTARSLSAVRDAQALVECFDMLEETYGRRVNFARMRPLRVVLVDEQERLTRDRTELEMRVGDVVAMLETAAAGIDEWPLAGADCEELAWGMQRVYRRARKCWKRARYEQDPGQLHDWRKRAKYLRYHFQLLNGVDKDWADYWYKGFKELSDLLGDHHDLEVLRGKLDDMDATGLDPVAECELRILLREKQDWLYRGALELGAALLEEKPEKMCKRVETRLRKALK